VIVGGPGVSYGAAAPAGKTWKDIFLDEVRDRLDLSRVTFANMLPYGPFLKLLRVSRVHVYLTYPFVLSWSLLEAMSAGCLVVGSRTPPVEEVIRDGENGLLVDFFSPEAIASRVDFALSHPDAEAVRQRARQTIVERYDLRRVCLPAQLEMVKALQGQRADAGAAADVEHLPGDEAGVAVGKEQHRAGDIAGLA